VKDYEFAPPLAATSRKKSKIEAQKLRHSYYGNSSSCGSPSTPVPTFVLAGAQKAGTSAFFHLLNAHPNIQGSIRFEPHFFDKEVEHVKLYKNASTLKPHELCWYRQQYMRSWSPDVFQQEKMVTFEKTPVYLCKYQIAEYMKLIAPWTKVLVILRDPVERAFSNWKLSYQTLGNNVKPFEKILDIEVKHLQKFGLSAAPVLDSVDKTSSFEIPIPYTTRGDRALEASATLDLNKKDKLKCGSKSLLYHSTTCISRPAHLLLLYLP